MDFYILEHLIVAGLAGLRAYEAVKGSKAAVPTDTHPPTSPHAVFSVPAPLELVFDLLLKDGSRTEVHSHTWGVDAPKVLHYAGRTFRKVEEAFPGHFVYEEIAHD